MEVINDLGEDLGDGVSFPLPEPERMLIQQPGKSGLFFGLIEFGLLLGMAPRARFEGVTPVPTRPALQGRLPVFLEAL